MATTLAACGGDHQRSERPAPSAQPELARGAQDDTSNGAAGKGGETAAPEASDSAGGAPCERLSASDLDVDQLTEMGRTGRYRFYGEPRRLLCSEPGPGGVGECEIDGRTVILVEGPEGSFGLRSSGDRPAILRYGPDGIQCVYRAG